MTTDEFQRLSFAATIAFGIASQLGLLAAGMWADSPVAVICALLSTGAAYLAQHVATDFLARPAMALQVASVLAWLAGAIAILGA
jgi:hypothetical protein